MKFNSPPRFTSFYESFSDLIFTTLAIFVLLFIIIISQVRPPSETAEMTRKIAELESETARMKAQLQQAAAEAEQMKQAQADQKAEADSLRRELGRSFLIVIGNWKTRDDVDLHVIDPRGNEFSYQHKKYAGMPGELSEDTVNGPGVEIWEISEPPPGRYRIQFNLYERKGTGVCAVDSRLYFRNTRIPLRSVQLTRVGSKVQVATISVAADGNVTVE